jgi:hypothetical protein
LAVCLSQNVVPENVAQMVEALVAVERQAMFEEQVRRHGVIWRVFLPDVAPRAHGNGARPAARVAARRSL